MIPELVEAARVAREASTILDDRRVVEVLVTEEGLIVRGRYRDARHAFGADEEVLWRDMAVEPRLAANAVRLVVRRLEEKGEDAGAPPIREAGR